MNPITASLLSLSLAGMVLLSGCASQRDALAKSPLKTSDREELLVRLENSVQAWNRGDLPGHLALYDESVTKMTGTGPQPTIAAMETSLAAAYFHNGHPGWKLRVEKVAVRKLDTGAALMTGRFILSRRAQEKSGWFTLVWVRTSSGWKIIHDHTS